MNFEINNIFRALLRKLLVEKDSHSTGGLQLAIRLRHTHGQGRLLCNLPAVSVLIFAIKDYSPLRTSTPP